MTDPTIDAAEEAGNSLVILALVAELRTERERSAALVEALRFYADKRSWQREYGVIPSVQVVRASAARAALAAYEEGRQ